MIPHAPGLCFMLFLCLLSCLQAILPVLKSPSVVSDIGFLLHLSPQLFRKGFPVCLTALPRLGRRPECPPCANWRKWGWSFQLESRAQQNYRGGRNSGQQHWTAWPSTFVSPLVLKGRCSKQLTPLETDCSKNLFSPLSRPLDTFLPLFIPEEMNQQLLTSFLPRWLKPPQVVTSILQLRIWYFELLLGHPAHLPCTPDWPETLWKEPQGSLGARDDKFWPWEERRVRDKKRESQTPHYFSTQLLIYTVGFCRSFHLKKRVEQSSWKGAWKPSNSLALQMRKLQRLHV